MTTPIHPPTLKRRSLLACLLGLPAFMGLPALLGGCGSTLLPRPVAAPARFTLDDGSALRPNIVPAAGAPVLIVAQPTATPGCDDRHMIYLRSAGQLQAYAFHEWIDTPARMLAPLLVRTLQSSGTYSAVLTVPSTGSGVLRLETELIRLQQDFGTSPSHVRLTVRAVLIDTSHRRVLGWREFDQTVAASSEDGEGGVFAARHATQFMLGELSTFCSGLTSRIRLP